MAKFETRLQFPNVSQAKNYKLRTGRIHTGTQMLNLLEIANPTVQAMLLLDMRETEEQATDPKSKYGTD